MTGALVRIGTRMGVRLEALCEVPFEDDLLLSPGNSFCTRAADGTLVCVGGWDAESCRTHRGAAAREPTSGLHYDASDDDTPGTKVTKATVTKVTRLLRRLTVEARLIEKRKRRRVGRPNKHVAWHLFLTDAAMDVCYVWIIPFSCGAIRRMAVLPHPARPFTIENCCGSFKGLVDVDFRALKRMSYQRTIVDIVFMLGGTLFLLPERRQVDFRGVRTMQMLGADWRGATGKALDDCSITAYMVVLKGRLGLPLLPESDYLMRRIEAWCGGATRRDDVYDCVELHDINWPALMDRVYGRECTSAALLSGRSSVYLSRRGGVMMRLLMPAETAWSEAAERGVLEDSNRLLDALRAALSGRRVL